MRTTALSTAILLFLVTHSAMAQESALRVTEIGDLTAAGSRIWWMQPSADGGLLALASGPFNRPETTWIFDRRTRSLREIDLPQADEVRLSATGDRLVFTHWETERIWTADVSDPSTTRRVSLQEGWSPFYSPEGDRISFASEAPCDPARGAEPICTTILVIPSRGGEARRIAPPLGRGAGINLSGWSPDGLWIYYRYRVADGVTWARVAAAGGVPQTLFTRTAPLNPPPQELGLSPNGRFIALGINYRLGDTRPSPTQLEIWTSAGEQVLNERLPAGLNVFGWGQNDRLLGVQETRSEVIRWISTSGTANAALIGSGEQETFPHWSPDGRRLAFKVGAPDDARPAVMNADGTARRVYLDAPTVNINSTFPAWSPDGQWLAYRSTDSIPGRLIVLEVSTGRTRSLGPVTGGVIAWRSDSRGVITGGVTSPTGPAAVVSEVLLDGSSPRTVMTRPSTFSSMRPLYDIPRGMGATPTWFGIESDELRTLRADGSQQVLLAGVSGVTVVSGDGSRYAATATGGRMLVGGRGRAPVMVDLPGPLVAAPGEPPSGQWHPDGSRFFVLAEITGTSRVGILSVSAAGGPPQWLPIPEDQDVISFSLSPDGNRIAYSTGEITRQTLVEIEVRGLSGR